MSHFSSSEQLDAMSDPDFWESIEKHKDQRSKEHSLSPIQRVNLNKSVEFLGYTEMNGIKVPIDVESVFVMTPEQSKSFISELAASNELNLIEETLQSLAVKEDGTELLTAFPTMEEFEAATMGMKSVPKKLTELMSDWKKRGALEIVIDYEKA